MKPALLDAPHRHRAEQVRSNRLHRKTTSMQTLGIRPFGLFVISLLFLFPNESETLLAQNRPIRKLYKKYKHEEKATTVFIPGIIMHAGLGLANGFLDEETRENGGEEALALAWGIKKVRILSIEGNNPIPEKELNKTFKKLRSKGHEDLLFVRDKGSRISVMIRDKGKKLRSLLILISEDDQFTLIHAKTRINKKHLWQLIHALLESEEQDIAL